MNRKGFIRLGLLCLAILMAFCCGAEVLPQGVFDVGEYKFCYSPTGYITSPSEGHLYQIIDDDSVYEVGWYPGKVAMFAGATAFSDADAHIEKNTLVPKFIFCGGQYMPVLGIKGGFQNSTAPEVYLQDCITLIGANSFKGAKNIRSLTLPTSLTTIGSEAFADMPALESLYFRSALPPNVVVNLTQDITEDWGMSDLNKDVSALYSTPFGRKNTLTKAKFFVPRGSLLFYDMNPLFKSGIFEMEEYDPVVASPLNPEAEPGLEFVKTMNFNLEVSGYSGDSSTLNINSQVKSDDYELGLSTKEWPYNVTGIGYRALSNVSKNMKEISIPDEVVYIKDEGFMDCGAESLSVGNGLLYVGSMAFANMKNLKSFTLMPLQEWDDTYMWPYNSFDGIADGATLYYDPIDPRVDKNKLPFSRFANFVEFDSGVENIENACVSSFKAYAVNGGINIELNENTPELCEIFDINGRKVYSAPISTGNSVVAAAPGFYLVIVNDVCKKVIVL